MVLTPAPAATIRFAHAQPPPNRQHQQPSALSAIAGHFGNHHATARTRGSQLNISPIMAIYWTFLLQNVVKRILYRGLIRETRTYSELTDQIEVFRTTLRGFRPNIQAMK